MKKYIVAITITGVPVFYLLNQIQVRSISEILFSIDTPYLIAGFVFYFIQYLGRAYRFTILIDSQSANTKKLFSIVAVHNLLNHILPFRTGEATYIVLIKKYLNVEVSTGIATLILARVFDFVAIGLFFLSSVIFFGTESISTTYRITFGLFALLILTLSLIYMTQSIRLFISILDKVMMSTGLGHKNICQSIRSIVLRIHDDVESIRKRKVYGSLLSVSLFLWFPFF